MSRVRPNMMLEYFTYYVCLCVCCTLATCEGDMEEKIVGGEYANIRNFPHAVYLTAVCPKSADITWICGASILNQRIIITAAHCLYGCQPRSRSDTITAYAGHENLVKVKVIRNVVGLIIHSRYNDVSYENDIGLAVVERPFPFGVNIKRVIVGRRFQWNNNQAALAGWGIVNDDTEENTILLKSVSQRIRNKNSCSVLGPLEAGMFCAGTTIPDAARPAGGDSGSGLVTADFVLVGLLSFKKPRYPALLSYTNTTFYHQWIQRNSERLFCHVMSK